MRINPEKLNCIVTHVLETLPDRITRKRELLDALLFLMPEEHPKRAGVQKILYWLNSAETLQATLALESDR